MHIGFVGQLKSINTTSKIGDKGQIVPIAKIVIEVSGRNPDLARLQGFVGLDVEAGIETLQSELPLPG